MVWNKIAKDYEEEVLSLTKVSKRREQILRAIKKGAVLNLGTGSMPYLNKDLIRQGNKVIATDYSQPMLKAARHSFSHANLEYKLADNKKLPFKDNVFDSVVSINSILPEKRQEVRLMIKEVWRVLKPAGDFVAFLPSFEAVLESMAIYKTNPRIDRKNYRMFDSGQWQCFHTVKSIEKVMKESGFKKYKIRKVLQNTAEEIRQIKRIYGVNVSKHPSYHHFLVAEK
jgi:ubiquinone/menaquinone biosynthesis C-methylase UbiE